MVLTFLQTLKPFLNMDFHIIPECYVDTNLVETLVPPTKNAYNHQKGCNNVVKIMQNDKLLKEGFALGIIDLDKRRSLYTEEFEEVIDAHQLKLFKHPERNHYLIYVVPVVEKWILENAQEVGISLKDFDLPDDFLALQKQTKVATSNKDDRFRRLFKALRKREASGVLLLSKWIYYLKDNPYNADLDFLKDN
jgi:hypothetical protein